MNQDDQLKKLFVDQKIGLINSILNDLAKKFDLNFSFNYTLFAPDRRSTVSQNIIVNRGISTTTLDEYIKQLSILKYEQETLMTLIAEGALMYQCIDDSNPPVGIKDWVKEGRIYICDHVYRTHDSPHCVLHLRDMDSSPAIGYKSARFQLLFNKCTLN